jgi:threonine dehydratase
VPCSGGGLIAGAILAARTTGRAAGSQPEIIGVQPEGADGIVRSLAAGTPTAPPVISTIADGLTAPKPGQVNLELIRSARIPVVTVSDDMILAALGHLVRALRVVVEPAAAVGLAALLAQPSLAGPGTTGLVLSGSNVSMALLAQVLAQLPAHCSSRHEPRRRSGTPRSARPAGPGAAATTSTEHRCSYGSIDGASMLLEVLT